MAKKRSTRRASSAPAAPRNVRHYASVFPKFGESGPLSRDFAAAVADFEKEIGLPVWLLVQDGSTEFDSVDYPATRGFFDLRGGELKRGQPIALLIDSYGGKADSAFEFATFLQRYCGGFVAIIPRHAKSAATLISLGAEKIVMADFGELGPLDVQIVDPEREQRLSVLDDVQSLERLNAFAMSAMDEIMLFLMQRTRMKTTTLLPHVRGIVSDMSRPLFEKIDVVRYTQMSRLLKVAEEYGRRLLEPKVGDKLARQIARDLAEKYPVHEFIIYADEARSLGLDVQDPTPGQADVLARIIPMLPGMTAIGRIRQVAT